MFIRRGGQVSKGVGFGRQTLWALSPRPETPNHIWVEGLKETP